MLLHIDHLGHSGVWRLGKNVMNTLTGGKSLEAGEDPGDQSFVEMNVGGCPRDHGW